MIVFILLLLNLRYYEVIVVYDLFEYLLCLFVEQSLNIVKYCYYFLIENKHLRRNSYLITLESFNCFKASFL